MMHSFLRGRRSLTAAITLACLAAGTPSSSSATAAGNSLPKVPAGFTIQKVAGASLVRHPMMAGFDDRGRLYVAASAGKNLRSTELLKTPLNFIQRLEDTNGDGVFDKSTRFADKMTLPMGALWYRGALYVAAPPNIWRLEDTNGDGVADKRDILVDTFGFSGNAASIHGCFLGPDGRIYWCDGRHGHEFKDDKGQLTSKGLAARIFSCQPDGGDVESYCGGGMDNPVEIDFTPAGEMLGTVNILLSRPRVDCLMHWLDGGAYPHYERAIAEFKKTGDLLMPMTRLGHVAVSGMMRYRSGRFGSDYTNNVFLTEFNTHKVIRSRLTRSGATFTTRETDFLVSTNPDFHPTDVLEDADGSLLVIDTGGWFRIGCPVSKIAKPQLHGAIYRIRKAGNATVPDPRGLALHLEHLSPSQLTVHLNDSRPVVRAKTIDRLALAGTVAVPVLQAVILHRGNKPASVQARRNAVWALCRIGDSAAQTVLRKALADKSAEVRIAAAHSLGTCRDPHAVALLSRMVTTDVPSVRRQAASALGRICEAGRTSVSERDKTIAVDALCSGLEQPAVDRTLEHALIYALIRIADPSKTARHLRDANPKIRRGALIALDQMETGHLTREQVIPLLDTDDPALQKQALAVIGHHPSWAKETVTLLRGWLAAPKLNDDRRAMLRGVLLAQAGDAAIQKLVTATLNRPALNRATTLLLLEVMDRSSLQKLPGAWAAALGRLVNGTDPAILLPTVTVIRKRHIADYDSRLRDLAGNNPLSASVRIEAMSALAPRLKHLDAGWFTFLIGHLTSSVPPLVRLTAAGVLADSPLDDGQLMTLSGRLDAGGPLVLPVLLRAFARSKTEQVGLALVAALNRSPASVNLSPDETAALLRHYPPRVQKAGAGLLARLGVDLKKQQARMKQLQRLLSGGTPAHGRQVFFGRKAACFGCHTIAGQGGKVGPDLTGIGKIRTPRDLLEAIAFPSASFARGFRPYMVLTDAGRVYTGVISRQTTDAVYLRTAQLAEIRIPRGDIEEMKESSTSIMPKGLDKVLTSEEFRDVIAFLHSLR